jgi:hypothetical protein
MFDKVVYKIKSQMISVINGIMDTNSIVNNTCEIFWQQEKQVATGR